MRNNYLPSFYSITKSIIFNCYVMNTSTITKTKNQTILLGKTQTEQFQKRINNAMHSFNFADIFYAILDFKLHDAPDIKDFLKQANDITKVSDIYETIVKKVITYDTKCILCSIGKDVQGYEIQSSVKDCENIYFITKTALYFDIVNGELCGFGFCNGFLNKSEIQELTRI